MAEDPDKNGPADEGAEEPPFDRRGFLRSAALGGGVVGLGGLAGYAVNKMKGGATKRRAVKPGIGSEFTYDVSKFQETDPALRRCDELLRFPAGMEKASNVAVADGAILVCGDAGIRMFSTAGVFQREVRLKQPVHAVTVRGTDEILAGQDGRILVLDADGAEKAVWDEFPERFLPTSIEVAGDEVFVADAGNRVVRRLDATGRTLAVIGEKDPERNVPGFKVPSPYFCARMAEDGLLRVTNPGLHKVEAYTVDGDFELAWGKTSFAVEGFCGCCNPVSFAVFPDGSFVTGEKGLPRVKLYDPQGGFTGVVAGPEDFPEYLDVVNAGARSATGAGIYVAVDAEGRIVVLDVIGGSVRVMTMKEVNDG
jgi:hypothetical protein